MQPLSITNNENELYTPLSARLFISPRNSWSSAELFNTPPLFTPKRTSMSIYGSSCCSGKLFGENEVPSSWKSGSLYFSSPHNSLKPTSPRQLEPICLARQLEPICLARQLEPICLARQLEPICLDDEFILECVLENVRDVNVRKKI
jgi:hypothetical protein